MNDTQDERQPNGDLVYLVEPGHVQIPFPWIGAVLMLLVFVVGLAIGIAIGAKVL